MSFRDGVLGAARDAVCTLANASDTAYSLINENVFGGNVRSPGGLAQFRRLVCDNPAPPPPQPPPQFQGGQCTDLIYSISWTATSTLGNNPPSTTTGTRPGSADTFGPIGNARVERQPNGNFGLVTTAADQDGNPTTVTLTLFGGSTENQSGSITGVSVVGGAPDNCGDPPPDVPDVPDGGFPVTQPITYVNNEGDMVTEQGDFNIFAPVAVGIAKAYIPITVDVGGINFDGRLEIAPNIDLNLNFGDGSGGGGVGERGPEDDLPPPPDGTGEPEDDPTPRESIIAVVVRSQLPERVAQTLVVKDNQPDLYVPRLATVQFYIGSQSSGGWTEPIDVKTLNAYIPCPEPSGAQNVRADGEFGVTVSLQSVIGPGVARE